MPQLFGAYRGYLYQDLLGAYALGSLLLPQNPHQRVAAEQRRVPNDRFDDLELIGASHRCRIQIKSHTGSRRPLTISDLTSDAIRFSLADAVSSFTQDPAPADDYRLFATYQGATEALLQYLRPHQAADPLLAGLTTRRFKIDTERVWPSGRAPIWPILASLSRDAFSRFCDRFVLELDAPTASLDLRTPGPLEVALLDLLTGGVGVGVFPNNNRDAADAAAQLVGLAARARANSEVVAEGHVVKALALRVDYRRIQGELEVDARRLVPQPRSVEQIVSSLDQSRFVLLSGSPGCGKSWLMNQLERRLTAEGWIVALHYCFIGIADEHRSDRAAVETIFGSIIATLLERDPSLAAVKLPRFAATPADLAGLLDRATHSNPPTRLAILVDGIDHADRAPAPQRNTALAIIEELAALPVRPGAAIVLASQPGAHLSPVQNLALEFQVQPWDGDPLRTLFERSGMVEALSEKGLADGDVDAILSTAVTTAAGNPLYATYLARAVTALTREEPSAADVHAYLRSAPPFDAQLNGYYAWLLGPIAGAPGELWIAQLLSLLDFAVTQRELKEIQPGFAHLVDRVVARLGPVLDDRFGQGGLRIYHESFQRFIRASLHEDPAANVSDILAPVIVWLSRRDLFDDARAFRSRLSMLDRAGRGSEALALISDRFVDMAAQAGQPGAAQRTNLSTAADIAADAQDWSALLRLLELARAESALSDSRLGSHDFAELYGRIFGELFGFSRLVERLTHEGRCAFSSDAGLLLCRLCDQNGVIPPWTEYRNAFREELRSASPQVAQETPRAVYTASAMGRLRLAGRTEAVRICEEWFRTPDDLPFSVRGMASLLGEMYGPTALEDLIAEMTSSPQRAWVLVVLAEMTPTATESARIASEAVRMGLPPEASSLALRLGASVALFGNPADSIATLTQQVLDPQIQFEAERFSGWMFAIELAAARHDELTLLRAETLIPRDSWFHRWLHFCIALVHPRSSGASLLEDLRRLSLEIEPFRGSPRVCDLYYLHSAIHSTFQTALAQLDDTDWPPGLSYLIDISEGTGTWLQGERSGPLTVDSLVGLATIAARTPSQRLAVHEALSPRIATTPTTSEFYDTHARDQLLLAHLRNAVGMRERAVESWHAACRYLAAYGWHKDITIYELLDPLPALAMADRTAARDCLPKLQTLVERLLAHTDGKSTRHAIHQWIDDAAAIDPPGALLYIARDAISAVPAFGDLDHALVHAFRSLSGSLPATSLAAAWLAVGARARLQPTTCLAECEAAARERPVIGSTIWSVCIAALEDEGSSPADGVGAAIVASAARRGVAIPIVDLPSASEARSRAELDISSHPSAFQPTSIALPSGATSLQIAHAVRQWRAAAVQRPIDGAVNAVGWRILELVDRGQESSAAELLRRIARDTSRWDRFPLLEGLAEGLQRHGLNRLAAQAGAYSYTRSSDGWRAFGSRDHQPRFWAAVSADARIAWSILAAEVRDAVSDGGSYGVAAHTLELLAAHDPRTAAAAWNSACDTLLYRMPAVGPGDSDGQIFGEHPAPAGHALWLCIAVLLNNSLLQNRRTACASLAIAARHDPQSLAYVIDELVGKQAPLSGVTILLQVLAEYETRPFPATLGAEDSLRTIAHGPHVTARVLARNLLLRAGRDTDRPRPEPVGLQASPEETRRAVQNTGQARVAAAARLWPAFPSAYASRLLLATRRETFRKKMARALRRLSPGSRRRIAPVWTPFNEEAERALQEAASEARAALALEGQIDSGIEDAIGLSLLGNLDLGVRLVLSRTIRPHYLPTPRTATAAAPSGPPPVVTNGEFTGWVIVGHHELELAIGNAHDRQVLAEISLYAGYWLGDWEEGGIPFGQATTNPWQSAALSREEPIAWGPLTNLLITRDAVGIVECLVPGGRLLNRVANTTPDFESGLCLTDNHGQPALVAKSWRKRLRDAEEIGDQEPILEGMVLLARRDIYDSAILETAIPGRWVSVVTEKPAEDLMS